MGKTQPEPTNRAAKRATGRLSVCVCERERGEWPLCARVLPPAPWRGRGLLSALAFLFSLLASVVWVCGGCRARRSHVRPGSAARGDGRPDHGVGIQRWFHQTPTANGTASFPWHIAPREGGSHPALSSSCSNRREDNRATALHLFHSLPPVPSSHHCQGGCSLTNRWCVCFLFFSFSLLLLLLGARERWERDADGARGDSVRGRGGMAATCLHVHQF